MASLVEIKEKFVYLADEEFKAKVLRNRYYSHLLTKPETLLLAFPIIKNVCRILHNNLKTLTLSSSLIK